MIKLAGTPDGFQVWVWDTENADLVTEILRRLTDQQTLADSRHYDYAETLAGRARVGAAQRSFHATAAELRSLRRR